MHYVGVDLAWGRQRPTGIAVLDATGRLVHVAAVLTDDEILGAVAPFAADECVVAFDAPLIVTNPTGNRPAEAALNRDFARFESAGATLVRPPSDEPFGRVAVFADLYGNLWVLIEPA